MMLINLCWINMNYWANAIKNLDRNILDAKNIVQCVENSAISHIMSMKNLRTKGMNVRMDIKCKVLEDLKITKIILPFWNLAMKSKIKIILYLTKKILTGKTLNWKNFQIGALTLKIKLKFKKIGKKMWWSGILSGKICAIFTINCLKKLILNIN